MAKVRFEIQGRYVSPTTIISGNHSNTNNLMVIDKGVRREMRYCETESKVWKDEQNKDSVPTKIFFTNGILEVDEELNPVLIEFLCKNEKNGRVYKEIDLKEQANSIVEKEQLEYEAKKLIFESTEAELADAVRVLIPSLQDESIAIIKQNLLLFSKENPNDIISKLGSDDSKEETSLEAQITTAFEKQILIVSDDNLEIQWGVNKEKVVVKAKTSNAIKVAVKFFSTEENKEHKELLIQRLKSDDK